VPTWCGSASLHGQLHLLQEGREARIAAQTVQERIVRRIPQAGILRGASALQPLDRAIAIPPPGQDLRYLIRGRIGQRDESI